VNNHTLRDQLKAGLNSGKLKVKYPDGYKRWKEKFDYFYKTTNGNLQQTLDIMYGPGGGVNNYKGSIYRNSNLDVSKLSKGKKKRGHNKTKPATNGALKVFKKKGQQ